MNKQILQSLTYGYQTDKCKLVNEDNLRSNKPTSFTALISGVTGVYNLFTGTVVFTGLVDGLESVNIVVNPHEMIRYLNLKSTIWTNTSKIGYGVKIGEVANNKPLGFEYCTQWTGSSKFPVRIQGRTWYKQNPWDILNGVYTIPQQVGVMSAYTPSKAEYSFNLEESTEWQAVNTSYEAEVDQAEKEMEIRLKAAIDVTNSD